MSVLARRWRDVEPGGPCETYGRIVAELAAKSANAARRNKPTMWAYYLDMIEGLSEWFADVTPSDGGYAGAALALTRDAERECPTLPPLQAARLWALGVYARRILRAWFPGPAERGDGYRVSLDWLRSRQGEANQRLIDIAGREEGAA